MAQELAGHRVGDDRALVADHWIVEAGLLEVRPDGTEHPSRHDDHVHAARAYAGNRIAGARAEHRVLGDQRPVEVDGECGDVARECAGKLYGGVPPVALTTYAATSAICWVDNWPLNDGIWPLPRVTRAVARR